MNKIKRFLVLLLSVGGMTSALLVGHTITKELFRANADVVTDLTGYTWVGNSSMAFDGLPDDVNYNITFTSDSASFTHFYFNWSTGAKTMHYCNSDTSTDIVAYGFINYQNKWADSAYQTIAISGGSDATSSTIITWLQANGSLSGGSGGNSSSSSEESSSSSSEEGGGSTSQTDDSYTKIVVTDTRWNLTTIKINDFEYEEGYDQTDRNSFFEKYYDAKATNNISRQTTTRGFGYQDDEASVVLCYGGNDGNYIYHLPTWITRCNLYLYYDGHLDIPLGNVNSLYSSTNNGTGSGSAGSGVGKIITATFNNQYHVISTIAISNPFVAAKDYPMVVNAWNEVNDFFVNADVGLYCWSDNPLFNKQTTKVTQIGSGQLGYTIIPRGTEYFKVIKAGAGLLPCTGWPSTFQNEWGTWPFDSTKNVVTVKYYSGDQEYNEHREILIKGMPVMFDTEGSIQSWWFGKGDRFFINVDGITSDYYGYTSSEAWFELTRIDTSGYMYYIPESTVLCTRVIVTRNSSIGSGWGNRYNQTTDMTTNYGFNPLYTTQVLSSTTSDKQNWSNLDALSTASEFGYYFTSNIVCDNGVTAPSVNNWNATKNFYDGLTDHVQRTAKAATAKTSGTNIEQAVAKYDYIINKYGTGTYSDFMSRGTSQSNNLKIVPFSLNNNSGFIIAVVVIFVLVTTGVIYFRFRKKEVKVEKQ